MKPNQSPFAPPMERLARRQLSMQTLLLLMTVFTVCAAAMLRNSVPFFSKESSAIPPAVARQQQLQFLLFCYAAPLLMAVFASLALNAFGWWEKLRARRNDSDGDESDSL
jgi:hypothetical protein